VDHHAVSLTTRSRPHSFKLGSFHAPHAPRVRYDRRWWSLARRPIRSRLTRRSVAAARVTRAPIGRCPLTMLTAPSSAPTTLLPAARRVCLENSRFLVNSGENTTKRTNKQMKIIFPSRPFISPFYFPILFRTRASRDYTVLHLELFRRLFLEYAQQRASSTCRKKFNI